MRHARLVAAALLCGLMGLSLLARAQEVLPSPAAGAQIVARVNQSFITFRDVVRRAAIMGANNPTALQTLIEDKVIATQAIKENISVSDEEIQKNVRERIAGVTTLENFTRNILAPLGMTMEDYAGDMKEQLLREKYIQSKIGTRQLGGKKPSDTVIDIFVSPREIKEFFERNRSRFDQPAKIHTRQIILRVTDNESRIAKKNQADQIMEQLKKGGDFAELAKQHSDIKADFGGDWGWTARGTFADETEQILFGLNKGEISPLIATERTFIIARIEDKTEFQPAFDTLAIQEEIRRTISSQKFAIGANAIKDKLLKEASIYVDPDFLTKP